MAKNGNLRVGHEAAAAAACQAGDGTAQREVPGQADADGQAGGRSGSIKKTEIIKIMILLCEVRTIAMQARPGPPKVELF